MEKGVPVLDCHFVKNMKSDETSLNCLLPVGRSQREPRNSDSEHHNQVLEQQETVLTSQSLQIDSLTFFFSFPAVLWTFFHLIKDMADEQAQATLSLFQAQVVTGGD